MPSRKQTIPVAVGADPADAVTIDWSKFNWLDAERPFRPFGRIPESARLRIERATNHFVRLAAMEAAAPSMDEAKKWADDVQYLTGKLLADISLSMGYVKKPRPSASAAEKDALKQKVALAAFLGNRIRQRLPAPPASNGRASLRSDYLLILHESLCVVDTALREVIDEKESNEPAQEREWQRWLGHICAALTENGLPATTNNTGSETPLLCLVKRLLKILPPATASNYIEKPNTALSKDIQRTKKAASISEVRALT
jgi:hypothetical protein